jgi:hypothetical protein
MNDSEVLKKWMAECVEDDWENVLDLNPMWWQIQTDVSLMGEVFLNFTKQTHCIGGKRFVYIKFFLLYLHLSIYWLSYHLHFLKKGHMQ